MRRNCATNNGNGMVVPVPRLHKVRQLMLKRPFKSLIARIAIVALALSLVVPFVPAAFAQDASIDYAENGTGPVQTFVLNDQDASSGGWSVGGRDAALFEISSDGALSFKKSPNYESPADVGGDNTYNVIVNRSGGSLDVAVNVTNVDEAGSVTLDDLQPQAGAAVSAGVSDPDGDTGETTWQWSKSMDQAAWEDISGATAAGYTPGTGDIGYYLRATASYSDGLGTGRDSASAATAFAVERRPAANSQPSFTDDDDTSPTTSEQTRMVDETAKVGFSVGNAVTATDADNDPLLYSLDGGDAIELQGEGTPTVDADDLFTINNMSGQISVKSGANLDYLDRETYTTAGTLGGDDAELEYTVTITAKDPSGSVGTVTVTIEVEEVDEAPVITRSGLADNAATDETTGGQFVVSTPEEVRLALSDITSEVEFGGLPVFNGDDPEDMHADISWSLSGDDAKRFQIANIRAAEADDDALAIAALRWATSGGTGPSFEAMDSADGDNVYLVTVTASDGNASKSQPVSITVQNTEEDGTITLSQLRPQEGIAITARLSDKDGGIVGTEWQWYRGDIDATDDDSDPVNGIQADELVALTDINKCDVDETTTDNCWIEGATSSTYIPKAADDGMTLTAVATYVDAYVTDSDAVDTAGAGVDDGDTARKTSANPAVVRPNENGQPSFGEDESVSRSVDENAKGASVGDPVTAIDSDNDPLLYTLSGDGSDDFSVDGSGQITTAKTLDYETRSSYTITVTATDPSMASESIVVSITVTDADDGATIEANVAPAFAEDSAELSVEENSAAGSAVGDPVTATDANAGDTLTYALSGDDAGTFSIDGSGQISVGADTALDFESKAGYSVTVTATDPSGASDSIAVTISVTDVNEAPTITGAESAEVAENSTEAVGGFTATDPDTDDTTTLSLSGDDAETFTISEDGMVSFAASPDFETPGDADMDNVYTVTVTATDSGEATDSIDVTVTVTDVNEAPTASGEAAVDYAEHGTDPVGTYMADDPDAGDAITWSLSGADAASFTISEDGMVSFAASPDFETPGDADMDNVYTVTVTATDSGEATDSIDVTVTVTDVNEAPTASGEAAVDYAEHGTDPVGTYMADDPDAGDAITWSLSGADAASFTISEDGILSFAAAPAEEASDEDMNGAETNGEGMDDAEANGEGMNGADANGEGMNGAEANDEGMNGADANGEGMNDADANGEGMDDADANGEGMDDADANGEGMDDAEAVASPNYEEPGDADGDNVYEVTVTATDSSGASDSVMVSVTVTDVDENNAPAFEADAATFSVDENTEAMAPVGDPVLATDADDDELTYALSGDGAAAFEIWPSGQITVAEGATLDYESQTSHMVTVTASDGKGGSASIAVTINVTNLGLDNAYDMNDDGAISKDEAVVAVKRLLPG